MAEQHYHWLVTEARQPSLGERLAELDNGGWEIVHLHSWEPTSGIHFWCIVARKPLPPGEQAVFSNTEVRTPPSPAAADLTTRSGCGAMALAALVAVFLLGLSLPPAPGLPSAAAASNGISPMRAAPGVQGGGAEPQPAAGRGRAELPGPAERSAPAGRSLHRKRHGLNAGGRGSGAILAASPGDGPGVGRLAEPPDQRRGDGQRDLDE